MNPPRRIKALAFDFDGVLADSLPRFLDHAREAAHALGYPRTPTMADLEALERMEVIVFAHQIGIPAHDAQRYTDEVYRRLSDDQRPKPLLKGMDEIVRWAASQVPLAIVTANMLRVVEKFLNAHDLADCFVHAYCDENVSSKADKLRQMAIDLNLKPTDLALIGDAISDVQAAQAVGAVSIAVTWGSQSRARLAPSTPDYLVADVPALRQVCAELLSAA
ncbi:MAG: HAD hydrolase-like protein [Rhodothermales bacterium]